MRALSVLVLSAFCLAQNALLQAQTTGSFQGQVLDTKKRPIPKASIMLSKLSITWKKTIFSDDKGKFIQVGLDPQEYDITVSAPGFLELSVREKIDLGLTTFKVFTLQSSEDAKPVTPGLDHSATDSFNKAVELFNAKKFAEALPLFETAMQQFRESASQSKDSVVQDDLNKKINLASKPYAICLMESAKSDGGKQKELFATAEPILVKLHQQTPEEPNYLVYLLEIAKSRQKQEDVQRYQAALDKIQTPGAGHWYNQGVELYNAGKLKEAKGFLQKAVAADPKFPEAYYLLAITEFADMNFKEAKKALRTYLDLAPKGKNASDAAAMLEDPNLKSAH